MEDLSSWKEKFEECIYAKKLLDKIVYLNTKVNNPIAISEIKKGIYYARKYHGTQMRKSGDPYYSHPIEVTIMLAEFTALEVPKLYNKAIMLQAALLHDTIEDTDLTEEIIKQIFGIEVAKHVEGLTRVKPYGKISAEESLNILIEQKRYDTALIKLFDRIHNVQTLGAKSPKKARKIIEETLKAFLTFATYLGINNLENKIIKLCTNAMYYSTSLQKRNYFLINDGYVLPFLAFQNDLVQEQILNLLASK
ncbi:MAG: HD domain-containing protein [Rickettsia endosymbiont of Argas persicus]